jgi:hypothetical protein
MPNKNKYLVERKHKSKGKRFGNSNIFLAIRKLKGMQQSINKRINAHTKDTIESRKKGSLCL